MNWLLIALGAIPTLILSLAGHSLYMDWVIEPGQRHALETQSKQLTEQCAADKKITEESSAKYQTDLVALNDRLNALRMRKPAACVPIASIATRPDATAKPLKLVGPYGLSTDFLYDFAGEAERYRLQVIGLQGFVKKVWGR